MESGLIVLSAIGTFIMLIVMRSEFLKKFEILNKNMFTLHKLLKQLETKPPVAEKHTLVKDGEKPINYSSLADIPVKNNSLDLSSQTPVVQTPPVEKPDLVKETEKPAVTETGKPVTEEVKKIAPVETSKTVQAEDETKKVLAEKMAALIQKDPLKTKAEPVKPAVAPSKPYSEKPVRDMEKLIGENWLNKIGIGILVIGIGFFVKYAIDKNWIGPVGRLSIGIATALVMAGIAHWLRKKYHAFSSVLIGGAIATLYYTISIGYHDYKLFTQPQAFSIMTVITIFATIMAVWYKRRELAIIGLIGGFTAPFMVAGETNNPAVFFTYIAILNTGMLALSFFKKWIELNRLAFAFSTIYLSAWILMNWNRPEQIANTALLFLIVFFVQFLTMNLVYNVRHKLAFNTLEFIHLLSISALFCGSFMYVLEFSGRGDLKGVFTVAMGTLFAALTILFRRLQGTENNNLVLLLCGKCVTFLTLTVFIQFEGYYVTLFWGLEAVVIYWIGMRANMNQLKNTSLIVTAVAAISLFNAWYGGYHFSKTYLPVVFNPVFATGGFMLMCYAALIYLLQKDGKTETRLFGAQASFYGLALKYWFCITAYLVLLLEELHQVQRIGNTSAENVITWMFHLTFLVMLAGVALRKSTSLAKQVLFAVGSFAVLLYVVIGNMTVIHLRDNILSGYDAHFYYQLHYVLPALFVLLLVILYKLIPKFSDDQKLKHYFTVTASLFGLYLVCAEMDHFVVYRFADTLANKTTMLKHTQVAGYTVAWGIYSFIIMIVGMRQKVRGIRVFALVAFSITLIKLFAFDIQTISEAGKIIAFISLGVMLLVISFLYQKLKKIIVEG